MKLNTKITSGALLVITALMTITVLVVTFIVDRQNVSLSRKIIDNAFHAVQLELSEMQAEQLGASRQVVAIEGIGADVKYLSRYKTQRIPRLTLTTYQRLAEYAYNTAGISGDIWKGAFYDRDGHLLAFSLTTGSGSLLGYTEGYPSAVFLTVRLSPGESLDDKDKYESWQEAAEIEGIRLNEAIQVPDDGLIQYRMIEGELCLQTVVPIKGLEFNQESDQLESVKVGYFMAIRKIGEDFTRRMADLTGQQVGIFHQGLQIAGPLDGYVKLQLKGSRVSAISPADAANSIVHNKIQIGSEAYYQGIMPLSSSGGEVASIAVLYSRDQATRNTLQMLLILFGVSLVSILLSIPLILIWTRSITQPIIRLRDTMQGLRGGEFGVQVDIPNRDEIGDLAASFNRMSAIIKQHNDELEAQVRSRTQNLEQKAIELKAAIGSAELANLAKSDALKQLEAQKASLEDLVRERTRSLEVAHENLKAALEQEKAAQIYKDQFLANMSHEIRTPLNGVVGFASLLHEEGLDAQTRQDYIATIESCSKQLLNLINDILDLAKIEAGEMKIEVRRFNVAQLARETASTLKAIRAAKSKEHLHLKICIPEDSENLEITSDPFRIQQILINLLGNAIKFSDKGTIEFGFEIKDQTVEFFVKDEGIGIAPERIELIYQRFEHLEGITQKYEGTGLGLSISKGLAELLGAKLSVESELGVGSVFRLSIPFNTSALPPSETAQSSGVESSKSPADSCVVLVAEDELANQKLIMRSLEKTPYQIILANNGKEAIQYYRERPDIDVVLMDIRMPIMDGLTAAREILKHDPDAKIIAQTAYAMREEREAFTREGFVDYLSKPYRAEQLIELIKKWA